MAVGQDRRRLLADGCVRTVFDKSNDFRERLAVAHVLADGIFAWEIRPLKGLVDDRHWRAADPVVRSKIASTQQANPHRVEITGTDIVEVRTGVSRRGPPLNLEPRSTSVAGKWDDTGHGAGSYPWYAVHAFEHSLCKQSGAFPVYRLGSR